MIKRRKYAAYAAAAMLAASPLAVLANNAQSLLAAVPGGEDSIFARFTPAGVDSELAGYLDVNRLSEKDDFAFTPAGISAEDRAVTIVVRSPGRATSMRKTSGQSAKVASSDIVDRISLTPTSYNLGAAKGIQSFTLPEKAISRSSEPVLPELGKTSFRLDEDESKPKRFKSRINVDEAKSVSATRQTQNGNDYRVDVGGSYSITDGVAVTAGVVLEGDQKRSQRLTNDETDSQAVYVGTMIKF